MFGSRIELDSHMYEPERIDSTWSLTYGVTHDCVGLNWVWMGFAGNPVVLIGGLETRLLLIGSDFIQVLH